MSYNNINIPVISIIPDDDVDDIDMDNDNDHMNIDEVATDTEDIYFSTEKRKKKTKKHHVPKKDPYATDVEDMEGSDNDDVVPLAKHAHPISLDDVLDQTDVPAIEETYKFDEKNKRGKPKLRKQASTTTNPQQLAILEDEFNQGLTDVEDFDNSSGDDEESEPEIPDTDLLNDIIHDAGTVAIADNVKKFLRTAPSPMVTPGNDISDDECEDDESRSKQRFTESSRLRPLTMSPQLGDLTDCELLQYDSNDELKVIKKARCNRTKKNSLRKNSAFAITDTEDMELSDCDQMKLRRMTVIGCTKSDSEALPPSTSKGSLPFILNELVNDEDVYSKLLELKRPKFIKHQLEVAENLDIGLTDTEDIEGDDIAEEELYAILDDSTSNFTGEFESYNGVVEEKVSSRKIQNLYRLEGTFVARKNRKVSDDAEDTDEEEYESDMMNAEKCKEMEERTIDFNFTSKKKPRMQRKIQVVKTKTQGNTLTASNAMEDSGLTDVENLESSEDDDDDNEDMDKEEIPMTIVNKDDNPTDSDSIDDEDDAETSIDLDRFDEELDDRFIPVCPRNLVKEKEKDDGTCDITVSLLQDEPDKLNIPNANTDALTDLEDFSGDDEGSRENSSGENEMPEIELDVANVNQCDSIKIPEIESDVDTDVEEIDVPRKPTRHTASKQFLLVASKVEDVITDLEDFDLSDNEPNAASRMTLAPNTRSNLYEAKTDVEDFEDSDNDQCRQVREMAVTPDILRQMGGDTICFKEGDGKFSVQERQRLNERSNSISFIDEPPSPTHTDEFITSADDDNYSRADTATPIHVRQQLDEASSVRVLSSNVKKINLDAEDEVMYLKGGGFMSEVYTDTEEMGVSDEEYFSASDKAGDKISVHIDSHQSGQGTISLEKTQNGGMSVAWHRGSPSRDPTSKEWGPSEDMSTIGEKPGRDGERDAALQGSERKDSCVQNQRTFVASCSKPPLYPIRNPIGNPLRNPSRNATQRLSSYNQLDEMLDHMLAEVDKQEKLVQSESPQSSLKPICINSLKLMPSTDAIIEIPIPLSPKKPKMYETKHEIILQDVDSTSEPHNNVDTDSVLSFESISDTYFLENVSRPKHKASNESLNDNVSSSAQEYKDDEHVYELVEPRENYTVEPNLGFSDDQEIWWEGTYRDLSIVPEEDEDDISVISSKKYKYIKQEKQDIPVTLLSSIVTNSRNLGEENCDTLSHHSSSDVSQTTGDECDDTSDMEHGIMSAKPVKAEIKLLVKTLDRGREDVEIRSVREFAESTKRSDSGHSKKKKDMFCGLPSLLHTFPKNKNKKKTKPTTPTTAESFGTEGKQPSFTLQRLFIRCPEYENGLLTCKTPSPKELSKSYPELVAASNVQYPLQYDSSMSSQEKLDDSCAVSDKRKPVDLYANRPFYPCYDSYDSNDLPPSADYSRTNSLPPDASSQFRAYCDWLLQPEESIGGISSSPTIQLASREDSVSLRTIDRKPAPVTGESIIHDIMSKDIKPVIDQTSAFIQMESRPDFITVTTTPATCMLDNEQSPKAPESQPQQAQHVKATAQSDLPDKASKDLDNKKEKNKGSKGFFSSLKSLVHKSLDSSDSESKEEKTPKKKKKKDKGTPKKGKKTPKIDELPPISPVSTTGKVKCPTPKEEKKVVALYIDNIPSIDDVGVNGLQITDLDVEPQTVDDVKVRATTIVNDVITNGEQAASKIMDGTMQEFNLEGTVTPEEVRKSVEPIIINEDEFLVVIEPKSDSAYYDDKTGRMYEDIREIPYETKSPEKKPLSESRQSTLERKEATLSDPESEGKSDNQKSRRSVGFLKIFSKKDSSKESDDEVHGEEHKSKDVPEKPARLEEHRKSAGFFGLFSKKSKHEDEDVHSDPEKHDDIVATEFSHEVQQQMLDSAHFLRREVELFDDVMPQKVEVVQQAVQKSPVQKSPVEKEQASEIEFVDPPKIILFSEEVQRQMIETAHFLNMEVEMFDDVKPRLPIVSPEVEKTTIVKLDAENESKDDQSPEKTLKVVEYGRQLSKEVQQQMVDTAHFLLREVEMFEDVMPKYVKEEQPKPTTVTVTSPVKAKPETLTSSPVTEKVKPATEKTDAAIPVTKSEKVETEPTEKQSGFFSKLGEKLSGKPVDRKEPEEQKDQKDKSKQKTKKKDKKGGFFSKIGEKFSGSSSQESDKETSQLPSEFEKVGKDFKTKVDVAEVKAKKATADVKEEVKEIAKPIKDIAQDTKDSAVAAKDTAVDTAKDSAKKTGGFFSGLGKQIKDTSKESKETVIAAKDSVAEKIKDTSADAKESVKMSADKVKDTAVDVKDAALESADKVSGLLSGIGKQVKDTQEYSKETVLAAKDSAKKDVKDSVKESSDKTVDFLTETGEHIKESAESAKDSTIAAKDTTVDKVKDTNVEIKQAVKVSSDKAGDFASESRQKIEESAKHTKDTIKDAKDSAADKAKEATADVKEAVTDKTDKAGNFLTELSTQIKDSVVATKDKGIEKVKDTTADVKETVKDTADKAGGFFSSLGKKIKGTAQDTKESVVAVTDSSVEKVKDIAVDVKDSKDSVITQSKTTVTDVKESAKDKSNKTEAFLSAVGVQIKETSKAAKDTVIGAKDSATEKITDATADAKSATKDTAEKVDGYLSSLGEKITSTAQETEESVVAAKESGVDKVKDTAADVKDAVKDKADTADDFFSKVGAQIKDSAIDTKDSVVTTVDSGVGKIKDTTSDTKEATKDSAEKAKGFFAGFGEQIKDTASDTKDTIILAKDSCIEKVKDTTADVKENVIDKTDKAKETAQNVKDTAKEQVKKGGEFVNKIGDKIEDTTEEATKTVISAKDSAVEKTKSAAIDVRDSVDKTGAQIKDAKDAGIEKTKDTVTEAKDALKETADKTEGFFTGLGKKIKGTAKFTKDSAIAAKDSGAEKVKATAADVKDTAKVSSDKTVEFISGVGEQIKGSAKDTKESIVAAKDTGAKKVKETASDVKETVKDSADKAGGFLSGLGKKIKGTAKDTKQSAVVAQNVATEKITDTTADVKDITKDSAARAADFFSDSSDKVKDTSKDAKESIISAKDSALEKVKETASDVAGVVQDSTEKTGGFISGLGQKIGDTARDTKESAMTAKDSGVEKVKETTSDVKDAVKESADKTGGFFSGLGQKIGDSTKDTKESAVAAKDSGVEKTKETASDIKDAFKESADKTGGFFSGLGMKIGDTAKDTKDTVVAATDSGVEKTKETASDIKDAVKESADKTGGFFSGLGMKVGDTAKDTKDTVVAATDSGVEKTKETASDIKDAFKESADKTGGFFSGLGKKVGDTAKDTKDTVVAATDSGVEKTKETASDIKDAFKESADKTGGFFSGLGKKVGDTAKDTKETVVAATDSGVEKTKETASDIKDAFKESADKTGGFFSGLGKKVGDTAKDTKESAVAAKDSGVEKTKETASDIKDAFKESADKTGGFFSGLGKKVGDTAKDTKESVVAAKDSGVEKTKETASDIKDAFKESADKTGGFFSGLGKKVEDTAKDTKDTVVAAKDSGVEKTKETASDIKDAFKESADKTGGFFSGLGKKVGDTAKDTKDTVVAAKDSGVEKTKETASDIKDAVKESADKTGGFFSGLGKKVGDTAKDTKDTVVAAKDSGVEKTKETASDIKDAVKESADKTGGFFSGLGMKIGDTAKDTKDTVVAAKDSGVEKTKETASDIKDAFKESADKTGGFFSGLGQKVGDTAKDTKESVVAAKDSGVEKTKETASDIKDAVKESADKTGGFFSGLGKKVGDTAKDTKESVVAAKDSGVEKTKETASDIKDAFKESADKTGGFFSGLGMKIGDTAKDTKDTVVAATDSGVEKTKETASDIKDAVKESADKTGGFFSGLGKKVGDTAKDTKESVVAAKDSGVEKTKETASGIKDAFKESADKTGGFFSGLGKKVGDTAKDTKETVVAATDSGVEKTKETASDIKDAFKESADKTGGFFSGLGKKVGDTAKDTKDTVVAATDSGVEKTKETASDIKDAFKESADKTGGFFSGLGKKVGDTAKDTKDTVVAAKDSGVEKTKETASDIKDSVKESADKTGGFFSGLGKQIGDTAKDTKDTVVAAKDSGVEKTKETASDIKDAFKESADKTGGFFSGLGKKVGDTAKDTKESAVAAKDSSVEKVKETASDVKDVVKDSTAKVGGFFNGFNKEAKDTIASTKDSSAAKGKKTATDVKETVTDSVDKSEEFFRDLEKKMEGSAKYTDDSVTAVKVAATEKVKDTTSDVKEVAKETVDKTEGFFSELGKQITDSTKEAKKTVVTTTDAGVEKVKDKASDVKESVKETADKAGGFFSSLKKQVSDSQGDKGKKKGKNGKKGVQKSVESSAEKKEATKIQDDINAFMSEERRASEQLLPSYASKKSDYVCYVTTPTMQRRGIGGSQRLSKDERPAPLDVSNMPIDISSDEDDYIVTEPTDKLHPPTIDESDTCSSPVVIEDMQQETQNGLETTTKDLLDSESKRRPLFHIGSRDEDSIELSDRSERTEEKSMHSAIVIDDVKLPEPISTLQADAKADLELIENKLVQLDQVMKDLEKASIDLDSAEQQEGKSDEKAERKLRRVERRFERMASETMEKDIKEAKDLQMTSPEVEAKREEEYRTMVSQLSQEEVSEYQRLYSTLWDEATFTPSEEWDSKTPDSQPDDIQELPQGDVVYMAPVTLNKDHLVNKAGIEVDVIPIKRSPCVSPAPKRKLQHKGRARSAMGFYHDKQVEERGSLPDLQSTGKVVDVRQHKQHVQKGPIMTAILKFEPSILKNTSATNSTSSLYYNAVDMDARLSRRKSTESLTKGTVISAVKDWMAKSTPFGSIENVRSVTDANSLADTTISIFDDDDIDSIDMLSDHATQSDGSRSDNPIPDIQVYNGDELASAMSLYDSLQFRDKYTYIHGDVDDDINDDDDDDDDDKRRVRYYLDQTRMGETSGGPLTNLTPDASTLLTLTNIDKPEQQMTIIPKPKPRADKIPDSQQKKSPTPSQEDEEPVAAEEDTEKSDVLPPDDATETYSDRKKFWESVASSKKEVERPEVSVKKRMSLFEEQIYKQPVQESVVVKKRTSVHEIGMVPPVPKPRSTVLTQSTVEEQVQKSESDESTLQEIKETVVERKHELVSEYRAAFKDPTIVTEPVPKVQEKPTVASVAKTEPKITEKSESVDSEADFLKCSDYQMYDNSGYISDESEESQKVVTKVEPVPQIKRRQMSISQPPVAATRKTIFERSVSLPTEDLGDVNEISVKARKQFFEQQIKNEMVIDQLMTQFEEEEPQEYKTLTDTSSAEKLTSPDEKQLKLESIKPVVKDIDKDFDKEVKDIEKKLSPISSSSSQDTRTEDDITQYTSTSVKDLTRYYQPGLISDGTEDDMDLLDDFISTQELDEPASLLPETKDHASKPIDKVIMEIPEIAELQLDEKTSSIKMKQPSTESEQSISSERSIELGSVEEIPSQIAEAMQYKSDSISKPSDSLEVHVDKSEIEDSEKVTDIEQDGTDVETKSLDIEEQMSDFAEPEHKEDVDVKVIEVVGETGMADEITETKDDTKEIDEREKKPTHIEIIKTKLANIEVAITEATEESVSETEDIADMKDEVVDVTETVTEPDELVKESAETEKQQPEIKQSEEHIPDTVWEVSIESQPITEIEESVTEIPIERQVIVEKDEELSGSGRDESELGSEIHQDHSESCESDRVRSQSQSEVEQLILESLYHQKIHPEEARKIAAELIDDIETEIQRRNLLSAAQELGCAEPPVPHPEVAKNQISDYLRQLAESKGLDAKEVELVESVLARKQNELSKLARHDTSSVEITDEDLKYSGAECDASSPDRHEHILEEQIEQLQLQYTRPDIKSEVEELVEVADKDTHKIDGDRTKDEVLEESKDVTSTTFEEHVVSEETSYETSIVEEKFSETKEITETATEHVISEVKESIISEKITDKSPLQAEKLFEEIVTEHEVQDKHISVEEPTDIIKEQVTPIESEHASPKPDESIVEEVEYTEKTKSATTKVIHSQKDDESYADDSFSKYKSETMGSVESALEGESKTIQKAEQICTADELTHTETEMHTDVKHGVEKTDLQTDTEIKTDTRVFTQKVSTDLLDDEKEEYSTKASITKTVTDTAESDKIELEQKSKTSVQLAGTCDILETTKDEIEGGTMETKLMEKSKVIAGVEQESAASLEQTEAKTITDDGTEILSKESKEHKSSKTVSTSQIVDHKREERVTTTLIRELTDETPLFDSDESKSSPYDSAKSLMDQLSSSSSARKDDSDSSHVIDKPEVILRRTKIYRDTDTSSSSGNLKADRKSGADFEAYSSSGESHYHSFEQDSARSRPCSSDVEGLLAAGSSEYESALTSQELSSRSSRSHVTSTEYHTAVSSLSSRESMKSLDSESSGHMASVEVSEASETLVPSTFEGDGDILDGVIGQLLEDEVVDGIVQSDIMEPYDREIPEHVIRGELPMKDKKSSFDTISDSDIQGESMDISEEDSAQDKALSGEVTGKMKRSQEMTFQPEPKAIIPDSPQSENLEMDERFGTSLEDGSVLSVSLSSQSGAEAMRTIIEMARRDSDRVDGSVHSEQMSLDDATSLLSRQDGLSSSNLSLDRTPTTGIDTSTSTGSHGPDVIMSSVTITTSTVEENGIQNVSTQVTSQLEPASEEILNGPTQVDYIPEYDDVVETKKVRGHRRQESTSTFVPSMIPGFTTRTDTFKIPDREVSDSAKQTSAELTLKEVHSDELKDVDETEDTYDPELDHDVDDILLEMDDTEHSRPASRISKTDSEDQRAMSTIMSEDRPDSELAELMTQSSIDALNEPIERPESPEPREEYEIKDSIDESIPGTPREFVEAMEKVEMPHERQMRPGISLSEKSSIEEGEAEAAFSMVAHVSPAHKAKGIICPILEDDDAEKHELETRERAQKELEIRKSKIIQEQSPGSIPDIMVTEHMTPLVDREFHYPDLELEEKEALAMSAPQTPASVSSKSSEDTDLGREYVLDDVPQDITEEPEQKTQPEEKSDPKPEPESDPTPEPERQMTESKSEISFSTVEEKTVYEPDGKEKEIASTTDSPNSDSFEMLEKPDIIDDFVVIEEVAKEAAEHDTEGKSVHIKPTRYIRKHDEEVEEYLVRSAPTPLTKMTELKYYPDGTTSDDVGPFDFEDSPPQANGKGGTTKTTTTTSVTGARSYAYEYDRELEASKKWIEMQFQGEQAATINTSYGYEMEFERGPLEDIKEEEATDFESSRIGSLDSTKQSIGSLGSVKDSFSSTPEYDVLAGRKFFTRSGEHDDVSMSSLQEFEHLEQAISLENRRHHQGSQDSSSNGSFTRRYHTSRSGQGDDVSMSSLKEFEGLETACIEAHKIEIKAKEEEALLGQIDEAQENLMSESESCKSISITDKKVMPESEEEDYEKRMFEIDEIIKQAQSNVEKFIDMKDLVDKTESMGRGDSLEEVAKVPDLELDEPIVKSTVHTVKWGTEDVMQTSTDSLDLKPSHHASTDSLDIKTTATGDVMTTSTDSIEFQIQSKSGDRNIMTDSIEIADQDRSCMIASDSLELTPGALANLTHHSDSIDEDGSRIGETIAHDRSRADEYSFGRDEQADHVEVQDHRVEYLLGSTDSLDPSSSTATHATYQYETDSVISGSFTSGGSNTMVSSTDTIDPLASQAHGVDLAAAVRKVWFDDDAFGGGSHFTTELLDDGSKPFVTEVIEPCEGDPEYSHTIHRKVELPPEIKKITFKGPDADLQLRQYIDNFGEGEDVQETQEVDKDGNIHVKRVVQKRFIVKSDPAGGEEKRISGPELETYLQQVSHPRDDDQYDLSYRDPTEFGLTKQTHTDGDGTKTVYGQKFTTYSVGERGEETALKELLTSIASDVTESATYAELTSTLKRHVDNQQETSGQAQQTGSGATSSTMRKEETSSADRPTPTTDESGQGGTPERVATDLHQLSSEMKDLLAEMEKHSKQ